MSRIVVTGMGIISSIGEGLDANRLSLKEGRSGISALGLFPSKYSGVLPCGEIKISTSALSEELKATDPGLTRTSMLAEIAFAEAIQQAGWSDDQLHSSSTALVNATTVGGMCLTDELYRDANAEREGSAYLSSYDYGSVALHLQSRYHLGGIINTVNTACSSSANSIMFGAKLIRAGIARRAIVGGVDSLAKFTINGFHALHILSPEPCRPFDKDRQGLNLGEAAAFLVLEPAEDATNRKQYAEISGYGNTNDSFHPSSLSENGEGPYLCMKEALRVANLQPEDIGFINAHGTGTENNDEAESQAMIRLFGQATPFASTKSNIGHTLGAAGAVEAVFSVFNLFYQEVYANIHFQEPIPSTGLVPVQAYSSWTGRHVMTNSFGFGGNCSSLIFSKV